MQVQDASTLDVYHVHEVQEVSVVKWVPGGQATDVIQHDVYLTGTRSLPRSGVVYLATPYLKWYP